MNPQDVVTIATGTTGVVAILIAAIRILWTSHVAQDADVKAQRDALLADNRAQTAANARLADAVEKLVKGRQEERRARPRT